MQNGAARAVMNHVGDWGTGFDFIFWLMILGAIIAGVVWFVRSQPLAGNQRGSSLEVLEERYARGEINREGIPPKEARHACLKRCLPFVWIAHLELRTLSDPDAALYRC
jgi:hypothetical protein